MNITDLMPLILEGRFGVSNGLYIIIFMTAWFLQMGLHEGGHAIVADRLGDSVPRMHGRVTVNPFKHIEWNNPWDVFGAVLLPLATTWTWGFPMGMASVPISGYHTTANHAKIALAGPLGSFAVGIIGVILLVGLFPFMESDSALQTLELICKALVITSLIYGIFNLVPIPPLDGSNILYHFMNQDGRRMMDMIRPYGFFIIMIAFWVFKIGDYFFGVVIGGAVKWLFALPAMIYG